MPNVSKKIVFVCYGGGHVNVLLPVIEVYQQRKEVEVCVLGLTTAYQVLNDRGLSPKGFKDYVLDDHRIRQMGEKLAQDIKPGLVSYEESCAYLGASYMDLQEQCGEKPAKEQYKRHGRHIFCPVSTLKRILMKERPDLVVTTNSPRAEKAAILASRELGLASVCVVDHYPVNSMEWVSKNNYADKLCVLNKAVAREIEGSGRSDGNIVVTGNPAFDKLFEPGLGEKVTEFRKSHCIENKIVIVYAAQTGEVHDDDLIIKELLRIVHGHDDWFVFVRAHPNDNNYHISVQDRVKISGKNDDLSVLLHASDLVITKASTVALEASLLGIDVLTLELEGDFRAFSFSEKGVSKAVKNISSLQNVMSRTIEARRIHRSGRRADFSATDKVVCVIDGLMSKDRNG